MTLHVFRGIITTMVVDDLAKQYASTVEASRCLKCRRETVFRLVQAGKLPASKVANRWLIPRQALEEFGRTYVARPGRPTVRNGRIRRRRR